jgi:hypothetical protein
MSNSGVCKNRTSTWYSVLTICIYVITMTAISCMVWVGVVSYQSFVPCIVNMEQNMTEQICWYTSGNQYGCDVGECYYNNPIIPAECTTLSVTVQWPTITGVVCSRSYEYVFTSKENNINKYNYFTSPLQCLSLFNVCYNDPFGTLNNNGFITLITIALIVFVVMMGVTIYMIYQRLKHSST